MSVHRHNSDKMTDHRGGEDHYLVFITAVAPHNHVISRILHKDKVPNVPTTGLVYTHKKEYFEKQFSLILQINAHIIWLLLTHSESYNIAIELVNGT